MTKYRKFESGGRVDDEDIPSKPGPAKSKPLPSEIKKESKAPVDKYIREPAKKLSDKVSDYADKVGLANPMEVVNEALGGETREESKARRAGMPTGKASKPMKSGGSVSSASKRADGCAIRGKTRA
jgi:hypothetical protein